MMDTAQIYGANTREYAGFWLRVVAWLLDAIILCVGMSVVNFPIGLVFGLFIGATSKGGDSSAAVGPMIVMYVILVLMDSIIGLCYYAGFECTKQATPGKMALGLEVCDVNGNRITFLHSAGRNLGKFVSGLIMNVGFIMCGFTERKQCLHDMMAGTLVVKKPK
jgi:uncharacterized RDD family membrane protein YckC